MIPDGAGLPRRNAFLDRVVNGRPVLRVRSRRGPGSYLVVIQQDGSARCNCVAALNGSPCYHAERALASFERRRYAQAMRAVEAGGIEGYAAPRDMAGWRA